MAYIQDTYALINAIENTCLITIPVIMVNPPFAVGQQVEVYHIVTGESLGGWWEVTSIRRRVPFRSDRTDPNVRVPLQGGEIEVFLIRRTAHAPR